MAEWMGEVLQGMRRNRERKMMWCNTEYYELWYGDGRHTNFHEPSRRGLVWWINLGSSIALERANDYPGRYNDGPYHGDGGHELGGEG